MSTIKAIWQTLVHAVGKPFYVFGSLASIVGLLMVLATARDAVFIAQKDQFLCCSAFDNLQAIPFDSATRSYEYHLINPEVGYFYRIS